MNTHAKQKLVDLIQQYAHILHKEGEDVVRIFECTRDLNRSLARQAYNELPDFPKLEPISRPLAQLSPETWAEIERMKETVG